MAEQPPLAALGQGLCAALLDLEVPGDRAVTDVLHPLHAHCLGAHCVPDFAPTAPKSPSAEMWSRSKGHHSGQPPAGQFRARRPRSTSTYSPAQRPAHSKSLAVFVK